MTEVEQPPQNGIDLSAAEDDDNSKARPADIEQDMREMERRKRVEAIMGSKLFREELERIVDSARDSGTSGILQQLSDIVGMPASRVGSVFKASNCMMPINDIRGVESMGYAKGEKILRCKLAATFRLLDLYGWTQGLGAQITARLKVDQEYFLVNPYGLLYHEMTASSLNKVDMQGQIVEQGTTNFGVNKSHFVLHSVVHAARPDIRCAIYIGASTVVAISSLKSGVLPLTKDACVLGEISTHAYTGAMLDVEERERLVRNLGPNSKVLLLSNYGALCCGETIEEAFFAACHLVQACETQLKLLPVGIDNLVLIPEESRKTIYEQSRRPPEDLEKKFAAAAQIGEENAAEEKETTTSGVTKIGAAPKWRVGGAEFEGLMRMLDNAGYRTGYIYRHPLIKSDPPKPKNDVELPPAVSSLGYLLEEEELFRQGIWKKGDLRKGGDRSRWLNSPNVYQKVEVLETGTPDPKKITKWVAEGSPTHSTPVRIEDPLQFVPAGTNPKEFKRLQQQIKDNRRADKISAGPQSHILEGVTWDEANRIKDATVSQAGDHVVLMGAASKGIIQRGFQHNATVYKAPYAKNPFDNVTDDELNEYKRTVERKKKSIHGEYTDTDFSESEALSSLQTSGAQQTKQTTTTTTAAVSQSEPEDISEHQVIRIETQQAPMPSQAEVVLSDATLNFINGERSHTAVNKKPPTGRDIEMTNPQATEIANELISRLNAIQGTSNINTGESPPTNGNIGGNKENTCKGNQNVTRNSPLMAELQNDPLFRKQREMNIRKTSSSTSSQSSTPPAPPPTPSLMQTVTATASLESAPTKRERALATPAPSPLLVSNSNSWFEPIVKSTCCVLRSGGLGACLCNDSNSFSSPLASASSRDRASVHVDTPRPARGSMSARSQSSSFSAAPSGRSNRAPMPILPSFEQAFSNCSTHSLRTNNNLYSVCYEQSDRAAASGSAQHYGSHVYESLRSTYSPTTQPEYEDTENMYKKSIFCCTPTVCESILHSIHQPTENDLIFNIPFSTSAGAGGAGGAGPINTPTVSGASSTTSAMNSPRCGSRMDMPKSTGRSTTADQKSPYRTVSHFGFNSPHRDPQPDHKHIPKSPSKTPIYKSQKGPGTTISYEGIFSSPRFVDLCENCFEMVIRHKPELLQMRTRLRNIADFHCATNSGDDQHPMQQHHQSHDYQEMRQSTMGIVSLHDSSKGVCTDDYPFALMPGDDGGNYDYVEGMSSELPGSYQPFSPLETVPEVDEPESSETNRMNECSRYQSSFLDKIMNMNYSEESTNINFTTPTPLPNNITLELAEDRQTSPLVRHLDNLNTDTEGDEETRIASLIEEAKRNTNITEIWEFGNWLVSDDNDASLARELQQAGDGDKSLTDTESSLNLHPSQARENLYELAFGSKHNNSNKSDSDANTTSSSRRRLDFSVSDEDSFLQIDQPPNDNDNVAHNPNENNGEQESPTDSGIHTGKRLLMDRDERLRRKTEFQELWEDHVAYFTSREQFLVSDTESAVDQQRQPGTSSSSQEGKKIGILEEEVFDSRTYVFKGKHIAGKTNKKDNDPSAEDYDKDKDDEHDKDEDRDKRDGNNNHDGNNNDSDSSTHSTRTYNVKSGLSEESLVKSSETLVGSSADFEKVYMHGNYETTFELITQNQRDGDSVEVDFQKLLSNEKLTATPYKRIEKEFTQIVDAIKVGEIRCRASTPDFEAEPFSLDLEMLDEDKVEDKDDDEDEEDVNSADSGLSSVEKKILKKIEKHHLNKSEEIFDKIETTIRNKKTHAQWQEELLAKAQTEGAQMTSSPLSGSNAASTLKRTTAPGFDHLSRSLNPLSPPFEPSTSLMALPPKNSLETPKQTQHNKPICSRSAPELKRRTQPKRNFILENIRKASTPRRQQQGNPRSVFGKNPFGPLSKKSESGRNLSEARSEHDTMSVFSFQTKVRGDSPRLWVTMSSNTTPTRTNRTAASPTTIAHKRHLKRYYKQITGSSQIKEILQNADTPDTETKTALDSPAWQKEIQLMSAVTSVGGNGYKRTRVDEQIDELGAVMGEAKPLLESCEDEVQKIGDNLARCTCTVDECIAEQNELAQEFEKFSDSVKLSQYADRISCMVNCSLTEEDMKSTGNSAQTFP